MFLHSPNETARRERGRHARNGERKTSENPIFSEISRIPGKCEVPSRLGVRKVAEGLEEYPTLKTMKPASRTLKGERAAMGFSHGVAGGWGAPVADVDQ